MSAAELHRRGVAALTERRFDTARALLAEAREVAESPTDLARIDASRAFLAYETGDPETAALLCQQALETEGLDLPTKGIVMCQQALLHLRRGRNAEALTSFASGIGLLSDPVELGKAHINRGGVYLAQGQARAAISELEKAIGYWDLAGREVESAMAKHNLGYAFMLIGDFVTALSRLDEAAPVMAAMSPAMKATVDQDRAEVLLAAGLVREGREALRDAARTFGQRHLHQRRGEAELALARTLLHTDATGALKAARSARDRFVRTRAEAWRVRADATILAAEVNLGRRGPSLVLRGDELVGELAAQGLEWDSASVRAYAARVSLRRGDRTEARRRMADVRTTDDAPLSLRLLARDVRAELAVAEGHRADAARQVRAGLSELHSWQSTFGSLDLQTMVVGHGRGLALRGLELAVESQDPRVLYEWSERARMLVSRVLPVRAPADDQMAADLAELRKLTAPLEGAPTPQTRRAEELRTRVRERAWQLPGSGAVSEPAAMADVQAALGGDQALVAWVVAGSRVVAMVLDDQQATCHDLGSRAMLDALLDGLLPDLDVAAADLPDPMARMVRSELSGRLSDLGRLLVAPLLDRLADRRLVLTPSGVLAGTPWSLLPGLVGRSVVVAQSATSWLGRQGPLELSTAGFVAGPRVPRAETEVAQAAAYWPGARMLVGPDATASAVSAAAAEVDVLHVAAHGRHSSDNPLFSGLELAGGPWYGYDIDQLPRVPQVVLLSACEVGRSTVRYGEELIGMTAAWLHAGVRYVVASPAAVNDVAAHRALTALHAALSTGLDPAEALAAAVPAAGPDGAPAPFVCFG